VAATLTSPRSKGKVSAHAVPRSGKEDLNHEPTRTA
jgi:hypothetical protein